MGAKCVREENDYQDEVDASKTEQQFDLANRARSTMKASDTISLTEFLRLRDGFDCC